MRKQLTIQTPPNIYQCYKFAKRTNMFNTWIVNTKNKIMNSTLFNGIATNKKIGAEILFNNNKGEAKNLLLYIKPLLDMFTNVQIIKNDNQIKHLITKRIQTKQKRQTCRFYLNKQLSKINKTFDDDSFDLNSFTFKADTIKYAIDPYLTNNKILKDTKILKSAESAEINVTKNSKLTIVLNVKGAYKANEQVFNASMYNNVDIDAYLLQISNRLDKPNNINEIEIFYTYSNHYSFFTIEAIE